MKICSLCEFLILFKIIFSYSLTKNITACTFYPSNSANEKFSCIVPPFTYANLIVNPDTVRRNYKNYLYVYGNTINGSTGSAILSVFNSNESYSESLNNFQSYSVGCLHNKSYQNDYKIKFEYSTFFGIPTGFVICLCIVFPFVVLFALFI